MAEAALIKNASSRKQIKDAEREEEFQDELEKDDLLKVLSTDHGRRVLLRIIRSSGILARAWEPSAKIHFNAGMQEVGRKILQDIEGLHKPSLLKMFGESQETLFD